MRVNRQPLKASARRSRVGRRRLRRTAGGDASHAYGSSGNTGQEAGARTLPPAISRL